MTRWTSAAVLVSLVVCLTHVTQGVHVSYEGSDYGASFPEKCPAS